MLNHVVGATLFRVCQDRTSEEYQDLDGWDIGPRLDRLSRRLAEKKVVQKDLNFVFRSSRSYGKSRYSDGSWPVFYSATKVVTSIHEVSYHARNEWLKVPKLNRPPKKIRKTSKILYTLNTSLCAGDIYRVKSTDETIGNKYLACNKIAKKAINNGKKALVAPSARHENGECIPIFEQGCIDISSSTISTRFTIKWEISKNQLWHNADKVFEKIEIFND